MVYDEYGGQNAIVYCICPSQVCKYTQNMLDRRGISKWG